MMATAGSMDHPSELVTAAYLEGALDPEATDRFERHLAGCSPCRVVIRDARECVGAIDVPVPAELLARARDLGTRTTGPIPIPIPIPEKIGLNGWRVPLRWAMTGAVATAAVAVIAVVLIPRLSPARRGAAPADLTDVRYRAAADDELTALSPLPGTSVVGPEATFSWSARPDANRYIVTVLDHTGTTLATIEARAPAHSAAYTYEGARPATLLWKVRALQLDHTLSESRPIAFQMR